jgi:hypothetical protein
MARKSPSFGQLLRYINTPEKVGPPMMQNFSARAGAGDLDQVHRELLDNSRYLPPRRRGNVLYHEILAFSDLDAAKLSPAILEDFTRRYLAARAPHALAYARAHLETSCPHVHLVISANNLGSSRRLRMSRNQFQRIKHDLERYQLRQYPFLEHSVAQEVKKKRKVGPNSQANSLTRRARQGRGEAERERRLKGEGRSEPSRKELVRETILQQLTLARSGEAFFVRLKILGLKLYHRGRSVCVQDLGAGGRRYRLSTLGLDQVFRESVRRWEQLPKRVQVLERVELERAEQLWHDLGFRKDILGVISASASEVTHRERRRLDQLHRVLETTSSLLDNYGPTL